MRLPSRSLLLAILPAVAACSLLTNLDQLQPGTCTTCADGGLDAIAVDAVADATEGGDAAPVIPTGDVTSVVTWGGAQIDVDAYGAQARADASGNVYVVGPITGGGTVVPLNGGKQYQPANSLSFQSMLAKFSPAGVCQWAVPLGGTIIAGLALDPTGTNVYVAGSLAQGPTSIGGNALALVGSRDLLVAKVSAAGSVQWAQSYGHATDGWQGLTVVADGAGNVMVGGVMRWSAAPKLGPVTATGPATSLGSYWGFLAAFTEAGTPTWARTLPMTANNGNSLSSVRALTLAKNGDVIAVGRFWDGNQSDGVNVDYGATGKVLSRNSGSSGLVGDALIVAYKPSASGQFVWAAQLLSPSAPSGQTAEATAVTTLPSGELYVGLDYSGPAQLIGGGNLADSGYLNLGVAKLDAVGKTLAVKGYPSTKQAIALTQIYSARVDPAGDLVIAGALSSNVDFGTGPVAYSGNLGDGFVAKLDATLKPRWVKTFAAPFVPTDAGYKYTSNSVGSVEVLPDGSLVAYGSYYDKTKFDLTEKTSNGEVDGFLAFMKP